MADGSTESIVIDAPAAAVMAVIADFPAYPDWTGSIRSAEVVEEFEDGYASQVRFVVEAGGIKDTYTLQYEWAADGSWVSWTLVSSTAQRSQVGSYELAERDGRTSVTYRLAIETAIPLLGVLRRRIERAIMDTALRGLKKRVETPAGAGG